MGRTLGDQGQVSLGPQDPGLSRSVSKVDRSPFSPNQNLHSGCLRNQLFKRVNILFLDSLLPSWSPRDETITMAVVLSCSGILWCETLS